MADQIPDSAKLLPCPNPWCDCPDELAVEPVLGVGLYGMDREAVERAAKAMAEAAKVGPWERMHEQSPRGWGEAACKSYWRQMATLSLSTLSADAIRQGEGLPQNVVSLVIAAREAFDTGMIPDEEQGALDKALEPFASSAPYANEPATPASHASDGRKA